MGSTLTPKEASFDEFMGRLFNEDDVIKVGMGITQDLKRLAWSYLHIPSLQSISAVLDIQTLAKFAYSNVPKRELEGLSKLSTRQLGLAVSKDEQTSDWGSRPLSRFQVQYAAIDALVQIRIVDSIFFHSVLAVQDLPAVLTSLCRRYKIHYEGAFDGNVLVNSGNDNDGDDRHSGGNGNGSGNDNGNDNINGNGSGNDASGDFGVGANGDDEGRGYDNGEERDLISLRTLKMKESGMPKIWRIRIK